MGTPWFQMKNERNPAHSQAPMNFSKLSGMQHLIGLFELNYICFSVKRGQHDGQQSTYASMSARVMNCLEEQAPGWNSIQLMRCSATLPVSTA